MSENVTILVVDDDPLLLQTLAGTLNDAGYRVLKAGDGRQALVTLEQEPVDLVIADVSMPGMNGYQLLAEMQKDRRYVAIPFLFMSARILDSDVRYGLELGADHYIRKPINLEDLLAMVRGKLRRSQKLQAYLNPSTVPASSEDVIDIGLLQIHPEQHRVLMRGEEISLSATEFKLLVHLAENLNNVVSPQEMVKVTHELDTDSVEASNLVRPLIRSLRRRLGYETGDSGCIENVRGVGYKLVPPDAR